MDIGSFFASLSPSQKGALLGGLAGTGLGAAAGGLGSKNNKLKSSLIGGLTGGLGGAGLGAGIGAGVKRFSGMNSKPENSKPENSKPENSEYMPNVLNYHGKLLKAPEDTPTGNFNAVMGGAALSTPKKLENNLSKAISYSSDKLIQLKELLIKARKELHNEARRERGQKEYAEINNKGEFGGMLTFPK